MIAWLPTASNEVEKVALPELKDAVPKVEAPSRKVTVPVGVPANCELTVAVNVTASPNTDGLTDEVTAVELLWADTVVDTVFEVLLLLLGSGVTVLATIALSLRTLPAASDVSRVT